MIKCQQNQYGNWRVYVTGEGWVLIGSDDFDVVAFIVDKMQQNTALKFAGHSWITNEKLEVYRIKVYGE